MIFQCSSHIFSGPSKYSKEYTYFNTHISIYQSQLYFCSETDSYYLAQLSQNPEFAPKIKKKNIEELSHECLPYGTISGFHLQQMLGSKCKCYDPQLRLASPQMVC
jgi:hypothetical protein